MLLTCKIFAGRPVMGSWISYALGTENQNLPRAGLKGPGRDTRSAESSSGPTDSCHRSTRGIEFNTSGSPVHHLKPAEELLPGVQEQGLDYLARINRLQLDARPGETELGSRIQEFRSWRPDDCNLGGANSDCP